MSDSTIIDRRKNGKHKSTTIRQKFLRRARGLIKKAVRDAIEKRKISDTGTADQKDNTISIPTKGISEPTFGHGSGGSAETGRESTCCYIDADSHLFLRSWDSP